LEKITQHHYFGAKIEEVVPKAKPTEVAEDLYWWDILTAKPKVVKGKVDEAPDHIRSAG